MAWFVEKQPDWHGDDKPGLLIHDGGDSIFVPGTEIEDFLVELGKTITVDFAELDVKGYIKLLIHAWRESSAVQEEA